jgi:uncharacterized membrane protein YbhN (UPF0104 family)
MVLPRNDPALWKRVAVALKALVTISLLLWIVLAVDRRALLGALRQSDPALLALAVAVLCVSYFLGGLRWWCVLRALEVPANLSGLIGAFWVGGLMSQVLPNPLGDAVRVSIVARSGVGVREATISTLIERVLMIVALLVFLAATEPMLRGRVADLPPMPAWALMAAGLTALGIACSADRVALRLPANHLSAAVSALSKDFRAALSSRWTTAIVANSLLANLNLILAAGIVGAALGLPLSARDYLALMPLAMVAMVLPISVAGWGVREGVIVALFAAMRLPGQLALAFSLLYGLSIGLSTLPGLAMLWLPHAWRVVKADGHLRSAKHAP